eukprot:2382935-Karenia_brevis.AAC.1
MGHLNDAPGVRMCGGKIHNFVAATGMHMCFQPNMYTWRSKKGEQREHIIDYIGISDCISHFHGEFYDAYDFDCRYAAESRHFPVVVNMNFKAQLERLN